MALRFRRRTTAVVVGVLGLSMGLAACGGDDEAGGDTPSGTAPGAGQPECADVEEFGDLTGKEISVYTSIREPEAPLQIESYKPFEECTGATVNYEGSAEFEAQLLVRVQSGNPPDIAYLPQPGLLRTVVTQAPGSIKPVPESTVAQVDANFDEGWKNAGTVDGTFYAAPLGSNVKSFVWYSPQMFADAGYEVPETWDDLIAISDQIVASGEKPWCAGIGSGDATGWPVTDWVEDIMLREHSPEVYDQWVNHDIPFNDPQVVAAFDRVGSILKNEEYVNAGIGDVRSIASTTFQDGGLPILAGDCWLHRQASFYGAQFPSGTDVSENGDVWAFYFPPIDPAKGKPVLTGGEFVGAFADRIEVQAFQTYLATTQWANTKAQLNLDNEVTGWVTANKNADANLFVGIDKLSVEILQDPGAVTRFDGSDMMPAAVGASAFWRGATDWITGASTQETVDFIESQWPQ
jgi:alpha-glucoside transport system substrate-binding protein